MVEISKKHRRRNMLFSKKTVEVKDPVCCISGEYYTYFLTFQGLTLDATIADHVILVSWIQFSQWYVYMIDLNRILSEPSELKEKNYNRFYAYCSWPSFSNVNDWKGKLCLLNFWNMFYNIADHISMHWPNHSDTVEGVWTIVRHTLL